MDRFDLASLYGLRREHPQSSKGEVDVNLKGLYTAVAALSLVTAPTIAAAAPISASVTQPAAETVEGENALAGGGFIIAILAAAAVIVGIIIIVEEDDEPNSP